MEGSGLRPQTRPMENPWTCQCALPDTQQNQYVPRHDRSSSVFDRVQIDTSHPDRCTRHCSGFRGRCNQQCVRKKHHPGSCECDEHWNRLNALAYGRHWMRRHLSFVDGRTRLGCAEQCEGSVLAQLFEEQPLTLTCQRTCVLPRGHRGRHACHEHRALVKWFKRFLAFVWRSARENWQRRNKRRGP